MIKQFKNTQKLTEQNEWLFVPLLSNNFGLYHGLQQFINQSQ